MTHSFRGSIDHSRSTRTDGAAANIALSASLGPMQRSSSLAVSSSLGTMQPTVQHPTASFPASDSASSPPHMRTYEAKPRALIRVVTQIGPGNRIQAPFDANSMDPQVKFSRTIPCPHQPLHSSPTPTIHPAPPDNW